jgi:hypothetical protein
LSQHSEAAAYVWRDLWWNYGAAGDQQHIARAKEVSAMGRIEEQFEKLMDLAPAANEREKHAVRIAFFYGAIGAVDIIRKHPRSKLVMNDIVQELAQFIRDLEL